MTEVIIPPKPESKPPSLPKQAPNERPASAEASTGKARATLEQIANGVPVAEAGTMPDREAVQSILSEANAILLELRDMRLLVNSVATQAADTPLGNEVRLAALRSIEKINTIGLPPDAAAQLTALQEKIKAMHLPPASSDATLALLTTYNEQYPEKKIPENVMESIRTGDKTAAESVAQMLQTNNDLAGMTWKELTQTEGFTKLNLSPGVILDLAGLPQTPDNNAKAAELFGIPKAIKEPPASLKEQLAAGAMYGALAIMFFSQIALGQESGQH